MSFKFPTTWALLTQMTAKARPVPSERLAAPAHVAATTSADNNAIVLPANDGQLAATQSPTSVSRKGPTLQPSSSLDTDRPVLTFVRYGAPTTLGVRT